MNTITPVSNVNTHNLKVTNQAPVSTDSALANVATNPTSFSSYIEQALAQIGVANPTNANAPIIHNANRVNSSQKSLSTFIGDLFTILGKEDAAKQAMPTAFHQQQANLHSHMAHHGSEAIAAYNSENSTTVGNIIGNLQSLIQHLNDQNGNTNNVSSTNQTLQDSFQNISDNTNSNATLTDFLQSLTQNLQGQNPLGIIINTAA